MHVLAMYVLPLFIIFVGATMAYNAYYHAKYFIRRDGDEVQPFMWSMVGIALVLGGIDFLTTGGYVTHLLLDSMRS